MTESITQLETRIVAMAMSNPANTEIVDVKPQYFTHQNLAKIYLSVQDEPSRDAYEWYRIAKNKYHYTNDLNDLISLKDYAPVTDTPNYFKQVVRSLHKDYLRRKVAEYAQKFSQVSASNKDYESLMQFAAAYEDIDIDSDNHGIGSAVKEVQNRVKHGTPDGLHTGYKELDYCLGKGLTGDTLMTIGADTNVGKTALAVSLASNIMEDSARHKRPIMVDYFTEEMSNVTILNRFISCRTGVSDWQLLDPKRRVGNKRLLKLISDTATQLQQQGLKTYEGFDLSQIISTIRRHASQRKPNTYVAIIDHVGIVPVNDSRNMPRYLQVGKISRELKELTTKFNIPIIMQSQVNRRVASRDTNELQLSDLNESSAIAQDSNLVILLYRDKKDDKGHRMVKVAKNRNGLTDKIPFEFYGSEMKFIEQDKEIKDHAKSN